MKTAVSNPVCVFWLALAAFSGVGSVSVGGAFADGEDGKGANAKGYEKKPAAEPPKSTEEERAAYEKAVADQFANADKNSDGYLKGAELGEGWTDRFDRNGDGTISKTEFTEIMARPPKLRRLHPMRDARARAADTTRSFDQDKNGLVERKEYPGNDSVFRKADRNRDNALQPSEMLALAEDEIEDIRKTMKDPNRYEFLLVYDLDKNNDVTADEFDGPAAVFRKFDDDKDGTVSYYELYPERMMRAREDEKKDAPEDKSAIATLDKDKDGKVARAEFAGSDAAWARMDTNGDGYVTAADK